MEPRRTIAVDMDGVLADIESQYIEWYYNVYGIRVPYQDLVGKPDGEAFPIKGAVREFILTSGFFRSLPVMGGAIEAIKELMNDFEIYVVSAAMEFPHSLSEKCEWLSLHFPFIPWKNIVFCGDKGIINTDYMIDDHPKNLRKFQGIPILFNAAHNTLITDFKRVNNWEEVVSLLR